MIIRPAGGATYAYPVLLAHTTFVISFIDRKFSAEFRCYQKQNKIKSKNIWRAKFRINIKILFPNHSSVNKPKQSYGKKFTFH